MPTTAFFTIAPNSRQSKCLSTGKYNHSTEPFNSKEEQTTTHAPPWMNVNDILQSKLCSTQEPFAWFCIYEISRMRKWSNDSIRLKVEAMKTKTRDLMEIRNVNLWRRLHHTLMLVKSWIIQLKWLSSVVRKTYFYKFLVNIRNERHLVCMYQTLFYVLGI